jgi:predicted ATPase
VAVREAIRGWRFYEGFRTDALSPVRVPQVGTFTPVLHNDGTDLPAALQTIRMIGDAELLERTVEDAFAGSRVVIEQAAGRMEVLLQQHGMLRPLGAAELSDGTLRFLMVLNEPETSLHPDLLPALARLILAAAEKTQIVVVSHAAALIAALEASAQCGRVHLEKSFGETTVAGETLFSRPKWVWPVR